MAEPGDYKLEESHVSVTFMVEHAGISWTHGRFNHSSGDFHVPTGSTKGSFNYTIDANSVDTNNTKRDDHLRSPDFFNVKQFPTITFVSTSVSPTTDGLNVTGDFTMHGVTKPISFQLKGGKVTEFPKGTTRTGYSTSLNIKRSDFGMDKMVGPIGDDIQVLISFEGVAQ
jgi:polyisoprenoid-binding protein YceI